MPDIEEVTPHRGYPLPNPTNIASNDASRLAAAITQIDTDIHDLGVAVDGKADEGHVHPIGDVSGLQAALDEKSDDDHTHALDALSDVSVSAAPAGKYLKKNTSNEWVPGDVAIEDVASLEDILEDKADYDENSLVVPRGTTAQRPSPGPGVSRFRFNTTFGVFEGWDGTKWGAIGGGAAIADTPPTPAQQGQFWWSSALGVLFIYYDDGTSAQWVSSHAGADPSLLLLKANNLSDLPDKAIARSVLGQKWVTIYDQRVVGSPVFGAIIDVTNYDVVRFKANVVVNPAMADYLIFWRGSTDGVTFDSGAGDYSHCLFYQDGTTLTGFTPLTAAYGQISGLIDTAATNYMAMIEGEFFRGSATLNPRMQSRSSEYNGANRTQAIASSDRTAAKAYTHLMIGGNVASAFGVGSRIIVEGC